MPTPSDLFTAQWIWEGVSQLPEDAVTNTWHFENTSVLSGNFDNIVDLLNDYYTGIAPDNTNRIIDYMSVEAITGNWMLKVYDMSDPKPRAPVYMTTGFAAPNGGSTLPTEVSVVVSFNAERVAGLPQARRRNRVYLGPVNLQAMSEGRVSPIFVQHLLFASKELLRAANASQSWNWVVYSPTNENLLPIAGGFVDNAFDTQRRRGMSATARGYYTADLPT